MDTTLTKDARSFVDGVVSVLKGDRRSKTVAPKVATLLGKMSAQSKKNSIAYVYSSISLTQAEKGALEKALAKATGRDIAVNIEIKPELIGGLRIQVGDWVLDTSLQSKLYQLSEHLMEDTYET